MVRGVHGEWDSGAWMEALTLGFWVGFGGRNRIGNSTTNLTIYYSWLGLVVKSSLLLVIYAVCKLTNFQSYLLEES